MTPPRFRLRTLLIAVAVAGIVSGLAALRQRRAHFLELAALHERAESEPRVISVHFREEVPVEERMKVWRQINASDKRAKYHHLLRVKYECAAARPWLPVAPDPPPP
jgi:hypothetical protein